jgi:hypothetical protein
MKTNDFVSINDILADVGVAVGDQGYDKGLTKGYYVRQVSRAVEELAFDTYFQVLTKDMEFPENFILEMPSNCFNLREIYLYNGVCGTPTDSHWVNWKRNFNNTGGGTDYTARRKETMTDDPFYIEGGDSSTLYCNIENGVIMFGSNCNAYSFVRLVYNGMGGEVVDAPIIPRIFRTAVIDYVRVNALTFFALRNPQIRFALQQAQMDLDGAGYHKRGSWKKAEMRMKSMDTWEKENYKEYFSRMNY